ncbi:MAG: DUF192 domain-containing protein [Anaerolineaceae bacterium]
MYSVRLVNQSNKLREPLVLKVCTTFFSRFRGFMLKGKINSSEGLLFVGEHPSVMNSSIHMFFLRFNLAVIWLDAEKRVVDRKLARAWHPYYAPRAESLFIIETHPDRLSEFSYGDQLDFEYE